MKMFLFPGIQTMILTVAFFGIGQGCGLLDAGSGFWIDIPDREVNFDVDVGSVKEAFKQWLDTQGAPYNEINPYTDSEIPDGITIDQTFPVEMVLQDIDLTNESTLKSYIDSGKIKGVSIKYLTYNLTSAPNVDLPAVDFYMDAYGTSAIDNDSKKVATLPVIEANQTGTGQVEFADGGAETMSGYFMDLQFTVLAKTDITINTAVDRTIPDGALKGILMIGVQFKVDPL